VSECACVCVYSCVCVFVCVCVCVCVRACYQAHKEEGHIDVKNRNCLGEEGGRPCGKKCSYGK
jgi:hypothetical protein